MTETITPSAPTPNDPSNEPEASQRPDGRSLHVPLAYLRTFIIVLVVAQHAAMPYNSSLPLPAASSLAEHLTSWHVISPVNDPLRSETLSLFTAFNDSFFMSLLFLLSGVFAWRSLQGKGWVGFLRSRLIRLGVPLVAMVLLRPLTYVPTYLQIHGTFDAADFWSQWTSVGWRGGPIWFLEILLLFNIALVLASGPLSKLSGSIGAFPSAMRRSPSRTWLSLLLLSAVAYVPITMTYGPSFWQQWGPAQVEVNRLLHYAVYFLAGVLLGAHGIDKTFLLQGSSLARRWAVWAVAALAAFVVYIVVIVGGESPAQSGLSFVLACATLSLASLAAFLRFARSRRGWADGLFENCYGIYVVHYGIVSVMSYALLNAGIPAAAKWAIAFVVSLFVCWAVTAAARRIPGVARVI